MNRVVIDLRVREIVIDVLGVTEDKVVPDASFKDSLGADSIGMFELYMAVENEFPINDVDDDIRAKILTVGDLADYLEKTLNVGLAKK